MASEAAVSKSTFSKSDVIMIAVLLACATATIIESHNRVLIAPSADNERSGVTRETDPVIGPIEPPLSQYQLTAP